MTPKEFKARLERLEDIEEINKLQRAYGYYIERYEGEQIVDLFSNSPDVSAEVGTDGLFVGPEEIKLCFLRDDLKDLPGYLNALMQVCGIVDVDPGGKTAKGRWYGFGPYAKPIGKVVIARWQFGVYENEYVKEDGKWKIKKLLWSPIFMAPYEDGWGKTPYSDAAPNPRLHREPVHTWLKPLPSSERLPYHYKNPVSGK